MEYNPQILLELIYLQDRKIELLEEKLNETNEKLDIIYETLVENKYV